MLIKQNKSYYVQVNHSRELQKPTLRLLVDMPTEQIPKTAGRTTLAPSIASFLKDNPALHLGGDVDFHEERRHHLEVFGWHNLPDSKKAPIGRVEHTAIRGPHGTIPLRFFYPQAFTGNQGGSKELAALVYFHGGGCVLVNFATLKLADNIQIHGWLC